MGEPPQGVDGKKPRFSISEDLPQVETLCCNKMKNNRILHLLCFLREPALHGPRQVSHVRNVQEVHVMLSLNLPTATIHSSTAGHSK
jgi:hypothetical protein